MAYYRSYRKRLNFRKVKYEDGASGIVRKPTRNGGCFGKDKSYADGDSGIYLLQDVHDEAFKPEEGGGGGGGSWNGPSALTLLRTITGQSSVWSYFSQNMTDYVGSTGRLVFWYETGTSYTGDIQLDRITINGSTQHFSSGNGSYQTTAGDQHTSSATTAHYEARSFSDVFTTTATGFKWNRDSGGTPSGSTALTTDASGSSSGYYLYAETSGSGWPISMWLRSPQVTLSNSSISYYVARYGATIGTLRVYWYGTTNP